MKMVQDKKLLQKFKKILRMSKRVKQTHAAKMMKISHDKLLALLFEWGDDLSFKLESDEIVIIDSEDFASEVDALFDDWVEKESTGDGKVKKNHLPLKIIREEILKILPEQAIEIVDNEIEILGGKIVIHKDGTISGFGPTYSRIVK